MGRVLVEGQVEVLQEGHLQTQVGQGQILGLLKHFLVVEQSCFVVVLEPHYIDHNLAVAPDRIGRCILLGLHIHHHILAEDTHLVEEVRQPFRKLLLVVELDLESQVVI